MKDSRAVVAAVAERGLLFLSDPKRANAIEVLTGEFPRGSWWSHPQANAIYDVLQSVEKHPDLLLAKLLAGKVTFIHRALWPALLAVVTAREPWQVEGLSPGAAQALAGLDQAAQSGGALPPFSRTAGKELESHLLARAENVHGASGRHETRLEPWRTWAERAGCPWPGDPQTPPGPSLPQAKEALKAAAARLGPPPPALPWQDV